MGSDFGSSKSMVVERNFGPSKNTVVDRNFGPSKTMIVDHYFGPSKITVVDRNFGLLFLFLYFNFFYHPNEQHISVNLDQCPFGQ